MQTSGGWRNRLKTTERLHQCTSLSHAHYKLSAEYQKRRLHIQNRLEGCVLSCTNTSRQQEVPMFCLRKQGMSVPSTSLQSEHCPYLLVWDTQWQLTSIVRGYR